MRHIMQGKGKTSIKIVVLILSMCLLLIPLLSEIFVLTHADHEHDHDCVAGDCAVCAYIHSVENLRKQIGTAVIDIAAMFIGLFLATAIIYAVPSFSGFRTPIALKDRIND